MSNPALSRLARLVIRIHTVLAPILFITIFIWLGSVQPGYDPLRYTVSRLAIGENGWIQNLNFLQLAAALLMLSSILTRATSSRKTKRAFRLAFGSAAAALILAAIFPTDPAETRMIFNFTPAGLMHAGTVVGFVFLSPYIIWSLADAFATIPKLRFLKTVTLLAGKIALFACLLWFIYYPFGLKTGYLGLGQKVIITWALGWILTISLAARRFIKYL
jgi:hypothetical protein